jgi:hypothetical protein
MWLAHVEDALAVGALGELVWLESAAADRFRDGDAAAGTHAALDVGDGDAPLAAADVLVEVEGAGGNRGTLGFAAGIGTSEQAGQPFGLGAEGGGLGFPAGLGASDGFGGALVIGLEAFDGRQHLKEFVFEATPLGFEQFELVLDVTEFLGIADGAVVEPLFLGGDAGAQDADFAIESALVAPGFGEALIDGGEAGAGGLEFFAALEAAPGILEGGAECGGLVIEFLERAEAGNL